MEETFRSAYVPASDDTDPYSVSALQELLQRNTDWINIQDIVRNSLKAVCDTVRMQAEAIKDLERTLATKASKSEVSSGLLQKANVSDVSRTIAEVAANMESKVSLEDLQELLKEKVSSAEFQRAMNDRPGLEEMQLLVDRKVGYDAFKTEMQGVTTRMDEVIDAIELQTTSRRKDYDELKIAISNIAEEMQEKASKETVANALKKKADISDIETALMHKVDVEDAEKIISTLNSKADSLRVSELQASIELLQETTRRCLTSIDIEPILRNQMAEVNDRIEETQRQLAIELEEMRVRMAKKSDTSDLELLRLLVSKKADVEKTGSEIVELKYSLNESAREASARLDSLKRDVEILRSALDGSTIDLVQVKQRLEDVNEDTKKLLDRSNKELQTIASQLRAESQEGQIALKKSIIEMKQEVAELDRKKTEKKDFDNFSTGIEEKVGAVKSFETEINTLKKNIDAQLKENDNKVLEMVEKKTNKVEAAQQDANSNLKETILRLYNLANEVKNRTESHPEELARMKADIEKIFKELALKSNIKDVYLLLDGKASTDHLAKALKGIEEELGKKANEEEIERMVADQGIVNEALCAENCVVRWLWKSGALKNGYAIPWEIQSVNTCPDNFLWEKDQTSVIAIAPGLYELTMGFFTKKKPTVQLLINGEPVLSAVNSASYVIHHSSGKLKSVGKHSAGNITGLTLIDFISLPPKARITVSYNGDPEVEGFLGLRKL
jgi:hypothetical protein